MLTIRPFRNTDPPLLLRLWKQSRDPDSRSRLIPLSINTLLMQVLGLPMFDPRSIMLAFNGDNPVGYVHTTPGPTDDGSDLCPQTGQICFLAVDLDYPDKVDAARALLDAAEHYLVGRGALKIYGGSPRPCAPFYIGFHGGAEAIGFFDSQSHVIRAFEESGYALYKTTARFRLNLRDYVPPFIDSILEWEDKIEVGFSDFPLPKTWWEACSFANFEWIEAVAKLKSNGRPVARIRVRVANPDTEEMDRLYKGCWDVGLMDVRVHPDFHRQGVAAYTLRETLRRLMLHSHIMQIEAHIADDSSTMYPLLRLLRWEEVDTGKIFCKQIGSR